MKINEVCWKKRGRKAKQKITDVKGNVLELLQKKLKRDV